MSIEVKIFQSFLQTRHIILDFLGIDVMFQQHWILIHIKYLFKNKLSLAVAAARAFNLWREMIEACIIF